MTKRKQSKPEIIEYKSLKAAAGGGGAFGGGGGNSGFIAGQEIECEILQAEPGGYLVSMEKYHLNGFLPTEMDYKPGDRLIALFICNHNNRILLSVPSCKA